MISCRIALNELPDYVIEQVLCIDEVTEDNGRWRLLSENQIGRSYKFTPKPHERSYFVRWGYNYSWNHFRRALIGQDEATSDWRNTGHAERHHIPVIHYRLLGTPRLLTGSLDTLLVTEYIERARSLREFLSDPDADAAEVERTIIKLGDLLAHIHESGMLHHHFELDNVLIQYDDATRLTVTDWYDMRLVAPEETQRLKTDVSSAIKSLLSANVDEDRIASFTESYARRLSWLKKAEQEILERARELLGAARN